MTSCSKFLPSSAAAAVVLGLASLAQAEIIWSDNFTGQTADVFPSMDFAGGAAGNDYTALASTANAKLFVDSGIGNLEPSLALVDTSVASGNQATLQVTMDHFAPFTVSPLSATPMLRLGFDFRVDSFLAATTSVIPRFILRADNTTATGSQVVIAFGYNSLNDGDADQDLTFYAVTQTGATSNVSPSSSTAIGLIPGVGWEPGFDFGTYNGTDAASNDSDDEFFRISMEYASQTGAITGSLTRLSTGQTAAFPAGLALTPGKTFSNNTNDRFLIASSDANAATAYFDNLSFEAVPEPSTAVLMLAGLGLVCPRRRIR
jgi:hypothetical protein